MQKYSIQDGKLTLQIVETTRDIQVKYLDDDKHDAEIQIWHEKHYYIDGQPIKKEDAACTCISINPQTGSEPFGNTGLTILEALTVLNVFASNKKQLPINIIDGTFESPSIPSGIGSAISDLELKKAELEGSLSILQEQTSQAGNNLSRLTNLLDQTAGELELIKEQHNMWMEARNSEIQAMEDRRSDLDLQIKTKLIDLKTVTDSLVDKSNESTNLTLEIEAKKASLG